MTVFGIAVLFLTIEISLFFIIDYKDIKPLNVSDTSEERVIDDSECATVAIEPDGDGWSLVGPDPYFVYGSVNSYVEDVEVKFTDEQEYTDVVLYYDVGEGFNESYKTSMTLEEGSTYKARLKKNIYNIRVDIENKPVGATITDMDIVIDSDIGNYKFNMNFFCISNIIFLLIFVILTIYELYIKDEKFSLIIVKTIICGLIIGLSECAFFRLPFKDSLIVISFDLLALITSSQFELDENSKLKNPYRFYGCLLACCFIYYLIWAIVIPFNHGPDEHMRYQIPEFIYKYGYLPHGDDARIRENSWGISYAFTPITSYIISAIFMKFTSIFTSDANSLILAARMVSVLSSVGTVFFCIKIGEKIFDNVWKYVFVIAVAIWPQFVFISCYVNNDAFGIMTVAWVTYQIIKGHEENWNLKSCVLLGVAAGLCLISYYNCYGIVAVAALFAVISVLKNKEIENKPKFLFSRILWVALAAFVVCGWWFIRNAIIYDGDFMGLTASGKCAEQYAIDGLKPSQRSTAYNVHMSLKQMMIDNHWLSDVVHSFVGCLFL